MSFPLNATPEAPAARSGRVHWISVAVYYTLACAISWPLFWWRDMHPASWQQWDAPGFLKGWLPALGPALGALVVLIAFPQARTYRVTLTGTSWWRSLAFATVTVAAMTVAGIGTDQPHLTGLLTGLAYLVYSLGEEVGWRGFLQGALQPLAPAPRYICIGLLWGTWHFTAFASGGLAHAAPRLALMSVVWILGSWGIGLSVDKTRSLTVAAMLHLLFNFSQALPHTMAVWVIGISVIVWVLLIATWKPAVPRAAVV